MKKYSLLAIVIVALAAGSYFTERSFVTSSVPTVSLAEATTTIVHTPPVPVAAQQASVTKTLSPATPSTSVPVQTATSSPAPAPNVTLSVAGTSYGVYAPVGATVLDAMRRLASTTGFAFTGHESSGLGLFVDSINGKKSADGSYWFLYVNGKSSDTGTSATTLKAGDTVEWRYEKNY